MKTLIVLLLVATNAYGAEIQKNYLKPELSIFTGFAEITDYYSKLVKVFSRAYENKSPENRIVIRVIVNPSFSSEYVIGIRQEGDKYIAFKLTAKENVWVNIQESREKTKSGGLPQKKIEVDISEMEVSEQTYKAIKTSWKKMIQNTKYPNELSGGLDGISYHFTDSNLRSGWAWNPEPESQTGYLVKLTELLGQLTESKEPKKIEIDLLNTATKLNDSLN